MHPPPGYPFEGPLKSRPPPPGDDSTGPSANVVLLLVTFAAMMMGTGFLLVAMMVGQLGRARTVGDDVQPLGAGAGAQTLEPSRSVVDSPEAPAVVRNVPVHPARFLEGCSDADLDTIRDTLGASIGRGAPLFNEGDSEGCAREYEDTAAKLQARLTPSCGGPIKGLGDGVKTAEAAGGANGRAWAMRDAFDGLLDVIERSRTGGVGNL
jgi:hypothetical protein